MWTQRFKSKILRICTKPGVLHFLGKKFEVGEKKAEKTWGISSYLNYKYSSSQISKYDLNLILLFKLNLKININIKFLVFLTERKKTSCRRHEISFWGGIHIMIVTYH